MRSAGLDVLVEAFTAGALDRAAACFAADATYQEAGKEPLHGREAIATRFALFAASGTRWRFHVREILRNEDRACVVYEFVLDGEGAGGSQRERAGCALVRWDESGSIIAWREYQG